MNVIEIKLPTRDSILTGVLTTPGEPKGLIIFAHGSGSGRLSPRNQMIAERLNHVGFATLLFDLLTAEEEELDSVTAEFRFNIRLISQRLNDVTNLMSERAEFEKLAIGLFGASTGAAAAIDTAADLPNIVSAVVSRGGRPDLAAPENLAALVAPTLFIVGSYDEQVIELNQKTIGIIPKGTIAELSIVQDATHMFEEKGKLEEVAELARSWFLNYLT